MAKINVAVNARAREFNPEFEAIVEIFTAMINDINPLLFKLTDFPEALPLDVRKQLLQEAMRSAKWDIVSDDGLTWRIRGPGVDIARVLVPQSKMLYHKYFEVGGKLQGEGIANHVMRVSLRITDTLKYSSITLHANLDVGGYAWLRKGAWPMDGVQGIIEAVPGSIKRKNYQFFLEMEDKFLSMSEAQARNFVLSPEFRKYKPLFLGADWQGSFNPNDIVSRTAMLQGADVAFETVVKNRAVAAPITLTSNEKITNEFVKHHLRSMGFSRGLALESKDLLEFTNDSLRNIFNKYMSGLTYPVDYSDPKISKLMREMEAEIIKLRSFTWDEVNQNLILQLRQYARTEAAFAAAVIEGAVPAALGLNMPSPNKLAAIVNSKPFEGRVLADWLKRTADIDVARITGAVKQAIVDGVTPTQLARRLLGEGVEAVSRKAANDLESVLLTASAQVQNDARQALYEENGDLFDEEYFIATLDSKTTFECAGHDGKRFKRGEGPMPPLHFRCRSLRAPYIGESIFRKRGFDSSTQSMLLKEFTEENKMDAVKSRADLPRGTKTKFDEFARKRGRQLVGQVPAQTNFNDWLKTQTPEFQNEYLGVTRAAAFRRGEFKVSDFVSPTGRTYRLEEIGI